MKYHLLNSVIALTLLLPAARLSAQQESTTVSVTGVVGDAQSGAAIANVVVAIPALRIRTLTDQEGRFVLENVPPGEHKWLFRMLGYIDWEEELELGEDEHLRVGLMPQPIVLENITVTVDGLAQRRKNATVSVHAVAWDEIRATVAVSAADVVRARSPSGVTGCPASNRAPRPRRQPNHPARSSPTRILPPLGAADDNVGYCIEWRGQIISPTIYLDEQLTPIGMDVLTTYLPEDIHTIEFLDSGRYVLVYTVDFMGRGKPLLPMGVLLGRRR